MADPDQDGAGSPGLPDISGLSLDDEENAHLPGDSPGANIPQDVSSSGIDWEEDHDNPEEPKEEPSNFQVNNFKHDVSQVMKIDCH